MKCCHHYHCDSSNLCVCQKCGAKERGVSYGQVDDKIERQLSGSRQIGQVNRIRNKREVQKCLSVRIGK